MVKIFLWKGPNSGISLKAFTCISALIFLTKTDADLFCQSETSFYCPVLKMVCSFLHQQLWGGEGVSEILSLKILVDNHRLFLLLWISLGFRVCPCRGLACSPRCSCQHRDASSVDGEDSTTVHRLPVFLPWYHHAFFSMYIGKPEVKHVGSWHWALVLGLVVRKLHCSRIGMFQVLTNELLQMLLQ